MTHNIPKPTLVRSSCQKVRVNPDRSVMALQKKKQTAMPTLRLTFRCEAMTPRGMAARVKTRVNAGPASTWYSMPVPEMSHWQSTSPDTVQLKGTMEECGEIRTALDL